MRVDTEMGPVELRVLLHHGQLQFEASAGLRRHQEEFPCLRVHGVPYRVIISGHITRPGIVVVTYAALRRGGSSRRGGATGTARERARDAVAASVGEWTRTRAFRDAWDREEEGQGAGAG